MERIGWSARAEAACRQGTGDGRELRSSVHGGHDRAQRVRAGRGARKGARVGEDEAEREEEEAEEGREA